MSKNKNFQHISFIIQKTNVICKKYIYIYAERKDESIIENDFKNLEMKTLY